ncbi:MAG TPA: D-2-hydroxyacid dehydrogenase [Candidatus Acidoferrales bacterium]|jgi:phosphoglycerate dehydrogenase-like enzyme|nr:D-2-hydroxyacid dehydrogenase [Candidatus Acidoferrales bacterium]
MNPHTPRDTKIILCVQFNFTFWRIPPELPAALQSRWPEMRVVHLESYDALPAELPDTDIFIGFTLTPSQLAAARKLKWIHVTAAGVAQLMRPDVRASGVIVTNARGIHAIPMAEHTMGMMIAFARKFPASMRFQAASHWGQQEIWDMQPPPSELFGATLLIVGLGAIGSELARRARAFGMHVLAVTRSGKADGSLAERVFPSTNLLRALPEADYVVLATPDTPETHHMIGARELAAMRRTACLVNIARGALVDELALIAALQRGAIAAAALDVAEQEPLPPESPLWRLDNVFITPHTSAVSEQLWPRQAKLIIENLERWFAGRELINRVDLTRGY